jgi:hypothetical protein
MPPSRRSATTKPASTSKPASAARGVRARASSTSAATRREVEQSIARFEKRLDDANDALQALGKTLGRGAQSSYKDVTTALRALRREATKTNRQALKDFDKLRSALTQSNTRGASSTTRSGGTRSTSTRSTGTRSTSGRSTANRSTTSGSTTSRASGTRSTRSRSTGTRSTANRSGGSRSSGTN